MRTLATVAVCLMLATGVAAARGEMTHECVLTYTNGDTMRGFLKGIVGGRFAFSPWLAPDRPMAIDPAKVSHVVFEAKPATPKAGKTRVLLTNGDRIRGDLVAITTDAVVVQTASAGRLQIPRKFVVSIGLGPKTVRVLSESHFASGRMAPWQVCMGTWTVTSGLLTSGASTGYCRVYAKVYQKEAVTFVAKVKAVRGHNMECWLEMFSDAPVPTGGYTSVYAGFYGAESVLGYAQKGRHLKYGNVGYGRAAREGIVRLAYDPKTGKVTRWLDSVRLGEQTSPVRPTSGQYLIFTSRYPCHTTYLRLLRGVVPPSEDLEMLGGDEDVDTVLLEGEEHVLASAITMAEGRLAIKTAQRDMSPDVKKVSYIVFRKKGREVPARRKGDVEIVTSGGRLTLRLKELTDTHLVGTSASFGEVNLHRDAIESIRFNPDVKRPEASPPKLLPRALRLHVK